MNLGSKHSEETKIKIRSYHHTNDARKRISESLKLRQFKIGDWAKTHIPWNKGKSLTVGQRQKISLTLKGRKNPSVAESNKHRVLSKETLLKRSLVMKKNLEKLWSSESFKKRMTGENNPVWIKDRTKVKMQEDRRNDANYKIWYKEVYARDNWKCKISNSDCKGKISAHHILSWKKHPELRYKVSNGITLCHAHHPHYKKDTAEQVTLFQHLVDKSSEMS